MSTTIYWTSKSGGTVNQAVNNVSSVLYTNGSALFLDSIKLSSNVLYYDSEVGQLYAYNLGTATNTTILALGVLDPGGKWLDLVIDPNGTTCVMSGNNANQLVRVNLTTGANSVLATITAPQGLAYDASGNLYCIANTQLSPTNKTTLYKLNATTGAVLGSVVVDGFGDGLCYDAPSATLYAAWVNNGTNATCLQPFNPSTMVAGTQVGTLPTSQFHQIDGVASNGDGNIYYVDIGGGANALGGVSSYTIASGITTALFTADNADDLCLSVGPLALSCNNPPAGTVGTAYSAGPSASGGTAPYTYWITSGSLPPGLSFNPTTGAITGLPSKAGTYSFTVQAVDSASGSVSLSCSITVGNGSYVPAVPPNFTLQKLVVAMKKERWLPVRGAGTAPGTGGTSANNALILRKVNVVMKPAPYTPVRGAAQ